MSKVIFGGMVVLAGLLALGWGLQELDVFRQGHFQPKYEQVRRNTFETSRAFNEGVAQELSQLYRDYSKTKDEGEKTAIKSVVLQRVAGYDIEQLNNPQLRSFVRQMMGD